MNNNFKPGARSLLAMRGIHPKLRDCIYLAYEVTYQDFTVVQGVRTSKEQAILVAAGASRSFDSRHLTGHAVDFAPYVKGPGLVWNWPLFYPVAAAFHAAALHCKVPLRWGAVWDRLLADLDPTKLEWEHHEYVRRFERDNPGKKALQDGGHIEIARGYTIP